MLFVLLLVLILAVILGVIRSLLGGTLTLHRAGEEASTLRLPDRPLAIRPTEDLIGVSGQMLVAGIPFTRRMHIWIRCPGRPGGKGTLRPEGERYVSGVWITHEAKVREGEPPYSVDHETWELADSPSNGGGRDYSDGATKLGPDEPGSGSMW
jgi:hypothetical protein